MIVQKDRSGASRSTLVAWLDRQTPIIDYTTKFANRGPSIGFKIEQAVEKWRQDRERRLRRAAKYEAANAPP